MNKITRLMTLMTLLLGAVASAWSQNVFKADPTDLQVGRTGEVEFSLTNNDPVYGLQAEILLPETLAFDEADGNALTLSNRAAGFTLTSNRVGGMMKIVIFSASHDVISGNSGVLLTAKVKGMPGFIGDDITVTNVILTGDGNQDITGEGGTTRIGFKPILVESITLSDTEWSGKVGESVALTATVLPTDATDKTVTWASNDATVATVDATGKVTAVKVGTATITATAKAGSAIKAECKVTVVPTPVETIALDKTQLNLTEGDSETLTATVAPEDATDKTVTWTSSDEAIATVDADGKVTAIKAGTATITATAGEKTANCNVTVAAKVIPVTGITLNKTELSLTEGDSETLTATVAPEDATDKTVTWTSSDEAIATVDADGKVTAIKVGTATITATAGEKTANCNVTVAAKVIPVTGITLNKTELSLTEGDSETLTAVVSPTDATDKTVTWASNDETVASVDADGKVTAIKAGTATITATAGEKTANCVVTVAAKVIPVTGIALNKAELSLTEGDSETLTATVAPEDATDKTVTWTSSDETVASVDADGKVTAIKAGTATITAMAGEKTGNCVVTVTAPVPEEIKVESIALSEESWNAKIGETLTLTATILPEDATNKTINWSSSAPDVTTVDEYGNVSAIAEGTAVITAAATDGSGISAECLLTVTASVPDEIPVEAILLSQTEWTAEAGWTLTLEASIFPEEATNQTLNWSSSNPDVASVDAYGLVTSLSAGQSVITTAAADGSGVSAECLVTVVPTSVKGISLDITYWTVRVGEGFAITATVLPDDAADKTLYWSSSDSSVASVDAYGNVTALAVGTAVITATAADGSGVSADCYVTVIPKKLPDLPILISGITLTPEEWEATPGETLEIEAEITPAIASTKRLYWSTSDEEVAMVDTKGRVTAVAVGEAVITAMALDGSMVKGECRVTVKEAGMRVAGISADAPIDVYTQTGVLIRRGCTAAELRELQPGIYIIHNWNTVKTLYLRP